jgi:predicted NBD/HSP70 family sugar kinase
VLAEDKFRTHPERGGTKAFERALSGSVRALMRTAKRRGLRVEQRGRRVRRRHRSQEGPCSFVSHLTFLNGYPFREVLEGLTNARVFVGHDVQAALYGEYRAGGGSERRVT